MSTKRIAFSLAFAAFMALHNRVHGRTVYEISELCGSNYLSNPTCSLSQATDSEKIFHTANYSYMQVSNLQSSEDCTSSASATDADYDHDQCQNLLCDPSTDSCLNIRPITQIPHFFRCKLAETIPSTDFDDMCGSLECTGSINDRDCGMMQTCSTFPVRDSSCPSGWRYSPSLQPHSRRATTFKRRPWRSSDGTLQFSPIRCKKSSISYASFASDKANTPVRFVPSTCDTETADGHECDCRATVEPKLTCDCVEEGMPSNAARLFLKRRDISLPTIVRHGVHVGDVCEIHDDCGGGEMYCDEPDEYGVKRCAKCVDARALEHLPADRLVFSEHKRARTLCDKNDSCATPSHVVVFNNAPMTMHEYCRDHAAGGCSRKVLLVNSPKYERAMRVPSRTQDLHYTVFAAQHGSWDAMVMKLAVRVGL